MNKIIEFLKKTSRSLMSILFFLVVLAGAFYWFEYRPTKIRQECSWVQRHEDAVPERPALTEEQLWSKGLLIKCTNEIDPNVPNPICESVNKDRIQEYKQSIPAKPARDWFDKATDHGYEFCIRSKGITK